MSKLKEERLNQMIENALSYKQEGRTLTVSYTHLTLPTTPYV